MPSIGGGSQSARELGGRKQQQHGKTRMTNEHKALIDAQEHKSASDAWRARTARERALETGGGGGDDLWRDSPARGTYGQPGAMHLTMLDRTSESEMLPAVIPPRGVSQPNFPAGSYRASKALAEGRVNEDETYMKLRLSARREHEEHQQALVDTRFSEPGGEVQNWIKAKDAEVPYKVKQVRQSRKDMRHLNEERAKRANRREKEAKSLLKEINFLIEREAQNMAQRKFSQALADEQRMKERRIAEFEGRLRRGQISLHLMGALKNVHRALVMGIFNEVITRSSARPSTVYPMHSPQAV